MLKKILEFLFGKRCDHDWSRWERRGITYQERRCTKCGWREVE